MKTLLRLCLKGAIAVFGLAGAASGQSITISTSVMGSGGSPMENTSFRMIGTVGQPAAGLARGAERLHGGGFWYTTRGIVTGIPDASEEVPITFLLEQNYPNPFNPSTVINGQWPEASDVRLKVVDVLGREVATLANSRFPPGRYSFHFDASNLSSGVYIYRLEVNSASGGIVDAKRMILVK